MAGVSDTDETTQSSGEQLYVAEIDQKSHYLHLEPSTSREQSSTELHFLNGGNYDINHELATFWPRVRAKIEALDPKTLREASRHQELQLPLARIKKIMKLDDDVKRMMIGSETPMLLAKASEIFVEELTLNAWKNTEENKRKTLQKTDISQAVASNDMFDFLIDIVPREESKRTTLNGGRQQQQHCEEIQAIVADPNSLMAANGNVQYVLQVGSSDGTLATGSLVQATQIGQPIQLPMGNQPIQLIALNLPDGNIQQFQVQLPQSL